jgi:hypothetical protein
MWVSHSVLAMNVDLQSSTVLFEGMSFLEPEAVKDVPVKFNSGWWRCVRLLTRTVQHHEHLADWGVIPLI